MRPRGRRRGRCSRAVLWRHLLLVAAVLLALGVVGRLTVFEGPEPTSVSRVPGAGAVGAGDATRVLPALGGMARASITIASTSGGLPVPHSFFGLSVEYPEVPLSGRRRTLFERFVALLPSQDPLILRIGGDSADQTYWNAPRSVLGRGGFNLTRRYLRRLGTLARNLRLQVILDLNLVVGSPLMASQVARAAMAELPPQSLIGFEIGNEPDLYHRRKFPAVLPVVRGALRDRDPFTTYGPADYAAEFAAYKRALTRVAPSVPSGGPAIANPDLNFKWLSIVQASEPRTVEYVSAHRYPLSNCVGTRVPTYPTVARVLSERSSAGAAEDLSGSVALARREQIPVRLTELNSVTCQGRAGVSDTFATALWAPDALFEFLRAGVRSAHLHVRSRSVNAPFVIHAGQMQARPLLYGLMLFARTLGTGAHLLPIRLSAKPSLHVKAWALTLSGHRLHLLIINKGLRATRFDVHVPATGTATVQRMLAPSAFARSGVTLAGQSVSPAGRLSGHHRTETITHGAHGYRVKVRGQTAALLSLASR